MRDRCSRVSSGTPESPEKPAGSSWAKGGGDGLEIRLEASSQGDLPLQAPAPLAQAKEDIEDTRNSLSADEQFLMELKEKCSMTDSEWEERQKTRQLEIEACSKALAICAIFATFFSA